MSTGKIISILLIVAGVIVLIVGVNGIHNAIDQALSRNLYAGYNTSPDIEFTTILQLIISVACIGTGIFIAVKEKNKS